MGVARPVHATQNELWPKNSKQTLDKDATSTTTSIDPYQTSQIAIDRKLR